MINILIVDDEEALAQRLKQRLEEDLVQHQPVVTTVTSAEASIEHIKEAELSVDIVLADHRLSSGMNGLELLEWLHQHDPHVDSVLFTGADDEEIGMRAYAAGAFRYLVRPFNPDELIWIVNSISQRRTTRYERNWLATLNEIAAETQQALTTEKVAQTLAVGGVKLGFERARIYRVVIQYEPAKPEKMKIVFQGYCQAGSDLVDAFETIEMPYAKSDYVRQVYDAHELTIFHGKQELGYRAQYTTKGDPFTVAGEWVGIPLLEQGRCAAVLLLDNPSQKKALHTEERSLLALFAQQAAAAWERAAVYEQRQFEQRASRFAHRLIDQTSIDGEPGDLFTLLNTMYRAVRRIVPTQNLKVVMKHHDKEIDEQGWLYYAFRVQNGKVQKPCWRPPQERSLTRYVIDHIKDPLYFPNKTLAYRHRHGIREPDREVQSLIAIPLVVGNQAIGSVVIEDFEKQEKWTGKCAERCSQVVQQLAHYLQSAWINHQRTELNEKLTLMQTASEKIIALTQQQPTNLPTDEWLWHATLTLATALYGFGFNRALLFLLEESGSVLQGRMGIGYLSDHEARDAWEADERADINSFDSYIDRLTTQNLNTKTPADHSVSKLRFSKSASTAFASVVEGRKLVTTREKESAAQLPEAFIQEFGEHDYWLIPVNAGHRLVGVLVLDSFCETEPPQTFALKYLDTLTNEAALIYENLRRNRAQRDLLELSRTTINLAYALPLDTSLHKIAAVAQLVTGADSVSIYPLRVGSNPPQLDINYITWYSAFHRNEVPAYAEETLSPLMQHVLAHGQPLAIDDVNAKHPSGLHFAKDPVVAEKGIRAFIVVPIRDNYSGRIDGLLYLNYRWCCNFADNEVQQAQAFANLTGIALRSWREHNELRNERDMRQAELQSSLAILQTALQPDVMTEALLETVLQEAYTIFLAYDQDAQINLAFLLLYWTHSENEYEEPAQKVQQHFLDQDRQYNSKTGEEIKGLSGDALRKKEPIRVDDVTQPPWNVIYYRRLSETRSELDIPVISEDGGAIGVINVESPQVGYFTETHVEMLQRLCHVARLALNSIQRRESMRSLLEAGEEITKPTDLDATLAMVSRQVRAILPNLSVMTVWYLDGSGERLVLGTQLGIWHEVALRKENPRPQGAVAAIMQRNEPLWAEDINDYDFFVSSNFIPREKIKSTAAFPLTIANESIGAIFFAYRETHIFTQAERELLPILAQYVAIGIQDARRIEAAEQQRDLAEKEKERLQSILSVTEAVGATLDFAQIVKNTRCVLRGLFPETVSLILSYDQAHNLLEIRNEREDRYQVENPRYAGLTTLPLDDSSMIGHLATHSQQSGTQTATLILDVASEPEEPYISLRPSVQSTMGVTFVSTTGTLLGGLVIESDKPNQFEDDDLRLAIGIARQLGLAIERWQQSSALDFRNVVTDSMIWAADLAHDLNRETYHIRSHLQTLREESELSADGGEAVEQIEASFDLILQDAPWAEQEPMESGDLVTEIVEWIREFVQPYRVTINVAADNELVSITLVLQVLKRAIRYLTRNAAKAMNYHGTITICTDYIDASTARIQFQDSGAGIKDDDPIRRRMFQEPLDDGGKGGLGLLFTRLHVEKLNGHIHLLEYEEGSGATFCIHLPLEPVGMEENEGDHDRDKNDSSE